MTSNQINYQKHLEDVRSNKARESETNRSNLVNEGLTRSRDQETKRANLAREYETNRANVAKETETNRSNLAREIETNRANVASEALKSKQIATESADRRYATDKGLEGSMYTADTNYAARTDSAYISQYGISPTDVGRVVQATVPVIKKVASNPTVQRIAEGGRASVLGDLFTKLENPSVAQKQKTPPTQGSGGHRH